ncbi:McrB family protein [Bacillus tropicus]|uniref:McrB family protein n=1 Tax=Bacillus tropicus TaxID=2026188 RepID=UPI0039777F64
MPKYFWVFQEVNWDDESNGGYIFGPKSSHIGRKNILKIEKDDIIVHFHTGEQQIKATSVALSKGDEGTKAGRGEGYFADVEYKFLDFPISKEELKSIFYDTYTRSTIIDKNGPFSNKKLGGRTGYCYELSEEAFNLIFFPETRMQVMKKKLAQLLENNKQLILTGAPGTGKSFLSKELANEFIDIPRGTKEQLFCVDMVQFHPSYDYTDFVEGLKPRVNTTSGSNISFELRAGTFKKFCARAGVIERILFNDYHNSSIEEINWTNIEKELKRYCESKEAIGFWEDWLGKIDRDEVETFEQLLKLLPKFVFIIDEINRAELSNVFGELMYSIESDYRGYKGKIKTQYSSLDKIDSYVDEKNDWFFIPSNVYIIGTMNDIDRSVESVDFALIRRFAWAEIKVSYILVPVLEQMLHSSEWGRKENLNPLIGRINSLNKVIANDLPGLSQSFEIGPSYFARIKEYGVDNKAYQYIWENHLHKILTEYLKGTGKSKDRYLEICEKAFIEGA